MLNETCEPESVLDFSLDSLNACLLCENQWAQMSSLSIIKDQGRVNTASPAIKKFGPSLA